MGGGSLMTPLLVLVFGFKPTVRDRHRHRARCDLQVVRGDPAPEARARARTVDRVDAARVGAVVVRRRRGRLVVDEPVRGRLRGCGEDDPRDLARLLRDRVPRQGLPAQGCPGPSVHPRPPRPGDRRDHRDRRWLRRRADLRRERHRLRPRDADRVPADGGEGGRDGHLPRRDPARRGRRRPPAGRQRRSRGHGLASDRLGAGGSDRGPLHREAPGPFAPRPPRGHAHARRRQARRPAGANAILAAGAVGAAVGRSSH